jgi:DNA-binding NtrC family response regulator
VIATPTLREQLAERPEDLRNLLLIIARRVLGEDEAPALANQVHSWVTTNLGDGYSWPGNIRELEQCVRNVLIRGTYQPLSSQEQRSADLFAPLYAGTVTAEEALRLYCVQVYRLTGSYVEAARRLGLDRRTVKAKVDSA